MPNDLAMPSSTGDLTTGKGFTLPAAIADHGDKPPSGFHLLHRHHPQSAKDQVHG